MMELRPDICPSTFSNTLPRKIFQYVLHATGTVDTGLGLSMNGKE